MSTQAEVQPSVLDIVKQVFSLLLVISGIAAFYYFSENSVVVQGLGFVGDGDCRNWLDDHYGSRPKCLGVLYRIQARSQESGLADA